MEQDVRCTTRDATAAGMYASLATNALQAYTHRPPPRFAGNVPKEHVLTEGAKGRGGCASPAKRRQPKLIEATVIRPCLAAACTRSGAAVSSRPSEVH